MGDNSNIQWTDATWNPVTGCTKISQGCKHCYAERMAKRLQAMGQPNYKNGFKVTMQPHMLEIPLRWKRPRKIFVNSMSDLFHEDVTDEYILRVFTVMIKAHWHIFQVLTKRADRLWSLGNYIPGWPTNVHMGVTIEDESSLGRANILRVMGASVKFLSCEPLLGPLPGLNLDGIDWVIVGGESGPNARPMAPEWVRGIRDKCKADNVPFFFKQWGGAGGKKEEAILDGRLHKDFPMVALRQPMNKEFSR
jgi:protein gp37